MEKKILIDGQESTIREFVHANTEQEGQIGLDELLKVLNAKPGESLFIGVTKIEIL